VTAPFALWLRRQAHRVDLVGDLARDAKADRDWPGPSSSLQALHAHLAVKGACREARAALDDAHREWTAQREDQPPAPVRVPCEVYAASPLDVGPTTASVGFCKVYPGGPHALLTLRQRATALVEVALVPDQAEALARKLLRTVAKLRSEQAAAGLTDDERALLDRMMRARGVVACRQHLGVGASSFDRALVGTLPVRPSSLWRIRERLSMRGDVYAFCAGSHAPAEPPAAARAIEPAAPGKDGGR